MPAFDRHQRQAKHNYDLLQVFNGLEPVAGKPAQQEYSDWIITISFYSAVHFVEALLENRNPDCISDSGLHSRISGSEIAKKIKLFRYPSGAVMSSLHDIRKILVFQATDVFSKEFAKAYSALFEKSKIARYECNDYDSFDYIESSEELELIVQEFNKITQPAK